MNINMMSIIFFISIQCFFLQQDVKRDGCIYGKVKVKEKGKYISSNSTKIYLQGTNYSINPDSNGIYYFPDVKAGIYAIVFEVPLYSNYIIEKVCVKKDSISIIPLLSIVKQSFIEKKIWKGIKIKRVEIYKKGIIEGRAKLPEKEKRKATIFIKGTLWYVLTDSLGNYRIDNILPGIYSINMFLAYYHPAKVYDVQVKHDSVSIVNFEQLSPTIIPEKNMPIKWKKKIKNN